MIRALLIWLLLAAPVLAAEPDEVLSDPALEERAVQIGRNVRCVVCASEAIEASRASIARDMRILVREHLSEGATDREVYDELVARYGDYVLFRPPFRPSTYALWLGPFAIVAVGLAGIALAMRRRGREPEAPSGDLSEEEAAELDRLLGR